MRTAITWTTEQFAGIFLRSLCYSALCFYQHVLLRTVFDYNIIIKKKYYCKLKIFNLKCVLRVVLFQEPTKHPNKCTNNSNKPLKLKESYAA